ncbi:hypothetical protein ABZ070_30415 [Streptomyces sp. NPDC006283]|uniref:hypothetical protein n=1 Tax=Streptomyces sp. NPDC006283 TaxID=3156741 RepID=UPI0033BCF37A
MDHNRRDRDRRAEQQKKERRLDLNAPQVAGSALAAVAAAVLASRLGVYGTIIGAGVVSVVATCGDTLFQHLFRRTGERIRVVAVQARPTTRQVHFGSARPDLVQEEFGDATTHGTRIRGGKRSALVAASVFAVAMTGITGYELAVGQELGGGAGTTVGSAIRGSDNDKSTPPKPSSDDTPQQNRNGGPAATPDSGSGAGGPDRNTGRRDGIGQGRDTDSGKDGGRGDSAAPEPSTNPSPSSIGEDPAPGPASTPVPAPSTPVPAPSTPVPAPSAPSGAAAP